MGVVFCFDISDRKSFTNLPHWMNKFIGNLFLGNENINVLLINHAQCADIKKVLFCLLGKPKKHNANPIPSFVVGCKSDLDDKKRMVTKYEAQAFAVKNGSRFVFTNTKVSC